MEAVHDHAYEPRHASGLLTAMTNVQPLAPLVTFRKTGHFAPCCPDKPSRRTNSLPLPKATGSQPSRVDGRGPQTVNRHIIVRNVRSCHRRAPTISVQIRRSTDDPFKTIHCVVPDGSAEVTTIGPDILQELGLSESDLVPSKFDLVMEEKKAPLLSTGQMHVTVRNGDAEGRDRGSLPLSPEMTGYSCHGSIASHSTSSTETTPKRSVNYHQTIASLTGEKKRYLPSDNNQPTLCGPLPNSPTDKEREAVMEAILSSYKDVFDQSTLRCMKGPEMEILLEGNAEPFAFNGFFPIPFADRDEVKRKLDGIMEKGIITPVIEPTEWVSPLVVAR